MRKPTKDVKFIVMAGHFNEKSYIQTQVAVPFYCVPDFFPMKELITLPIKIGVHILYIYISVHLYTCTFCTFM